MPKCDVNFKQKKNQNIKKNTSFTILLYFVIFIMKKYIRYFEAKNGYWQTQNKFNCVLRYWKVIKKGSEI